MYTLTVSGVVRSWFVLGRLCRAESGEGGIVRIEGLWLLIWTIGSIYIIGLWTSHAGHLEIVPGERKEAALVDIRELYTMLFRSLTWVQEQSTLCGNWKRRERER